MGKCPEDSSKRPRVDHKKEGNELFAKGDFLRAAAAYTRGIKAAPDSHVLYSNRAQAFLRLHKVGKAL